jgi:formylglycine-generating enzyme required for sulfatase activity
MDHVQPLAENLYNAASSYYEDGDFKEAETTLKQALRANPNHIRANELLAELLISQDRLGEARDLLEKLLENAPSSARPRLIQVYLTQAGQAAEEKDRLELFEKVLGLDNSQPEARAGLDKINRLAQEEKELAYRFVEGRQALQRGEWTKAREALLWVVQTRPEYFYDNQPAADLLAEAVRQGKTPPPRWKLWLRQTQTIAFLGGAAFLLLIIFTFAFGQKAFQVAVDQRVGIFGTLAPTFTPTPTLTPTRTLTITPSLTPSPTNTLPPTATPTPRAGSTAAPSTPRSDGMVMVYIPAGTFKMGSETGSSNESPVHDVTLDAFWMDQIEVTNAMYAQCVDAGECEIPSEQYRFGDPTYDAYPVVYVDWARADAYCKWTGGRLPTEAEWEYAARGGSDGKIYPWGDDAPICTEGAPNGANFSSCNKNGSIAVKTFSPNGFNLYDMAGNVWEWVADWYERYPGNTDSNSSYGTQYRVLRGGSWVNVEYVLRVSYRLTYGPDVSYVSFGFRCVRSP